MNAPKKPPRLYHLIATDEATGLRVYLTGYPMTHRECLTMRSKASYPARVSLFEVDRATAYAEYRPQYDALYARIEATGRALQAFPKGPLGLTPDDVKASPEWKSAHSAYWSAHRAGVSFNKWFATTFGPELRADKERARGAGSTECEPS